MITTIIGGNGMVVNGGSYPPHISQNINMPLQGMIRLNGSSYEAFNNGSWTQISSGAPIVELNADTQSLLSWAREQREVERNRQAAIDKHPQLKAALDAIRKAEANFALLEKIVCSEEPI